MLPWSEIAVFVAIVGGVTVAALYASRKIQRVENSSHDLALRELALDVAEMREEIARLKLVGYEQRDRLLDLQRLLEAKLGLRR